MFIMLALLRNVVALPPELIAVAGDFSRWILIVAIAAIGVRTDLARIVKMHPGYTLLLLIETLILLAAALVYTVQFL